MPTTVIEHLEAATEAGDTLLGVDTFQGGDGLLYPYAATCGITVEGRVLVSISQFNPDREDDDEYIVLTREQLLHIADQLRSH